MQTAEVEICAFNIRTYFWVLHVNTGNGWKKGIEHGIAILMSGLLCVVLLENK